MSDTFKTNPPEVRALDRRDHRVTAHECHDHTALTARSALCRAPRPLAPPACLVEVATGRSTASFRVVAACVEHKLTTPSSNDAGADAVISSNSPLSCAHTAKRHGDTWRGGRMVRQEPAKLRMPVRIRSALQGTQMALTVPICKQHTLPVDRKENVQCCCLRTSSTRSQEATWLSAT